MKYHHENLRNIIRIIKRSAHKENLHQHYSKEHLSKSKLNTIVMEIKKTTTTMTTFYHAGPIKTKITVWIVAISKEEASARTSRM